jgi:MGT family glycosyltransferase
VRFAFVHLPVAGHINPTLAVTSELRRRGVELAAFSSEATSGPIEAAGATAIPIDRWIDRDVSTPPKGLVGAAELLAATTETLLPFMLAADPVDLVIHDSMAPWGRLAARILGLPAVCSTSTFAVHRRMSPGAGPQLRLAGELVSHARSLAAFRATARRIRRRFGLPIGSLLGMFEGREWARRTLVYTSAALQPGAGALAGEVDFVGPYMREPEPLDRQMEAWIAGRPVIYVSLGTLFSERPTFLRDCLRAFGGREEAVVVSTGGRLDPGALGEPPANALVRASVPQLALLERARLFVTHAGMNSATEALWHGVPTLMRPQAADQPIVAARLARLGAGRILRRPTPGRIAAEADRVLAGDSAVRSRRIGESLRACPGPAGAADVIIAAAGG